MISHNNNPQSSRQPHQIKAMFNAIAPTYDLLNHLLSFGLDIRWRRKAVQFLEEKRGGIILDIAAGSGDFSLDVLKIQPKSVIATDFAQRMLTVFQEKLKGTSNAHIIHLSVCDALSLPFRDAVFDATIVGFGIRNFTDKFLSLKEMVRVLKPNGISLILELTEPNTPIISPLYRVYSRYLLPTIGRMVSRHYYAYTYLPTSIIQFPGQDEFYSMMSDAGFVEIKIKTLTFGIATIYAGRKGI